MPKSVKVECDQCGRDLTSTSNSIDYRLALLAQEIPVRGGIVTDMAIYRPLDRDAYFCGAACLAGWVDKKFTGGGS